MSPILIIKLGALGDILLADGALCDIRAAHSDRHIAVLTRRPYVALLSRCPWVDEVIVDDHAPRWRLDRMLHLRRRLRAAGFERVYDLQNSRRSRFYRRWLLGSVPASSFDSDCAWPMQHSAPRSMPVPERHAGQLRDAGIAVRHAYRPEPDWMCQDVTDLLTANRMRPPFVLLLPGASARHPHKRWPRYAELSHRLVAAGHRVLIVPGPDEAGVGAGFAGCVLRIDGRPLDLFELAGVARHAACVVGNDSGPTHLAALLDRPGVALFGARHASAEQTGMDRRQLRVLQAERVSDIPLDDVVEAVQSTLRSASVAVK